MSKLTTAQPKFNLLVANLTTGSNPSLGVAGNPSKARGGFTLQHLPQMSRHRAGSQPTQVGSPSTPGTTTRGSGILSGTITKATAVILVADNDFTVATTLFIGPYTVTSGEDFTVGGSVNATATALAAAISALPGFTAGASTATVTVTASTGGPTANEIRFKARHLSASVINYTLTPTTGVFDGGLPEYGAATILS